MAEQRDPEQDMLFREIEEDLREEQLTKLWKTYGNWIIGAAVAIVVAVAGHQIWRNYDLSTRQAEGERFAEAARLAGGDQADAALAAFSRMTGDARDGYAMLAGFREASLLARKGDLSGAALAYDKVASDDRFDPVYRDLARLLSVANDLDTGNPQALAAKLAPLTAGTNPWRFSAQELSAALALKTGDTAKAKDLYGFLSTEAGTPPGIRARATEMLGLLNG